MTYDEFIGQVQHRARLSSRAEAERATRAFLQTLGQRLVGGEPKHLASQLPPEIGRYLLEPPAGAGAQFGPQDMYELVAQREAIGLPEAAHHVRAVSAVLHEAVSPGTWQNMLAQLPPDLDTLLESGSEGEAPTL